ncbi:MAG: hypothetical protein QOC95_530 [Thermoleophilaceae bacterium]|nr:hypothetical protein [Thermoleophilaceae bacterium]
MTTASVSLAELARHGARELAPYIGRQRPPDTTLEWLGIAVGKLPDLAARARTADEVNWRRPGGMQAHAPLLDALTDAIAGAVAMGSTALTHHLERHPSGSDGGSTDADVEAYTSLLVAAHRSAPRRAEFLIGGYASFLGGAIEAAGALAEAELGEARARRWDRADPARLVSQRANQVYSALVNALGGLLAYARLTAEHRPAPD